MAEVTTMTTEHSNDPLVISTEVTTLITFLIVGVGCTALSALGMVTNSINIYVFYHQGLGDSVTISLMALSVSDLWGCICTFFMGICFVNERYQVISYVIDWTDLMDVAFAWPRSMFLSISMLITVHLSVERSLGVFLPHKVKTIITPFRTKVLILVFYAFGLISFIPIFATYGLSWQEDETTNTTRLKQWFSPSRPIVDALSNALVSTGIAIICFIIVTACTAIMIAKLRTSLKFLNKNATASSQSIDKSVGSSRESTDGSSNATAPETSHDRLNQKNRKVVFVVILVAIIFIVCSIPQVMAVLARRFVLELSPGKLYENLMWIMFAVVYFAGGINSSVNIFIYLKASSRYRSVLSAKCCQHKAS